MKDATRFSQNFLRSPRLVASLLSKTNIDSTDTVYDIGSGKGIITDALAEKCRTVISVEVDSRLTDRLRENLRGHRNVVVYKADFLLLPLPQTPYKVFASIPFNLSADIVRKLTDTPYPPLASYLIVQKEFANKLMPKPGGYHSQLSILLGVRFEMRIMHRLQPVEFYPRPRVTAVLLEIVPRTKASVVDKDAALFRDFIAYNYNAYQPSVAVGLSRLFTPAEFEHAAETLQLSANATPAQLNLQQWLQLFTFALRKRPLLEKLVSGYEQAVEQRHSKRSKLRRTRSDHNALPGIGNQERAGN